MKISVVTISYNQSKFLIDCIDSVVRQRDSNVEFIVVDAGSTDGSREILEQRRFDIDHLILEPDEGPADGLNKGFALATGDIFYYLNSDDVVFDGVFAEVRQLFVKNQSVSVLAGAGLFIDEVGNPIRHVWSDPIGRLRLAYGGGNMIQPATFIRASEFLIVGGFNRANRSSWDSELIVDLFLHRANFMIVNRIWAGYRLHNDSITSSGKLMVQKEQWFDRQRQKLGIQFPKLLEQILVTYFRFERLVRHPRILLERLRYGRVSGRITN